MSSTTLADGVLDALAHLGVPAGVPQRTNTNKVFFQKDETSCGFYVLHFIEEEVRQMLGEGAYTFAPDLAYRLGRLTAMANQLGKLGYKVSDKAKEDAELAASQKAADAKAKAEKETEAKANEKKEAEAESMAEN
jgi:hypothetical protein